MLSFTCTLDRMWFWLIGAIAAEVTATVILRYSAGFTRPVPSLVVLVGYGFAFYALSQALVRGMVLGVAYGIWSACGIAAIALIGTAFLGEPLTWIQVAGIALIIGGVLALELGGATHVD
jgi:small multidrug resistance pump